MADATLLNTPKGYKSSKIYSELPESGLGDFTFSRSSVATRLNKDRIVESVAPNMPRLDYTNGCGEWLFEPQRTNIFTYSNGSNITRNGFSDLGQSTKYGVEGTTYGTVTTTNPYVNKTFSTTDIGYWTISMYVDISQFDEIKIQIANTNYYNGQVIFKNDLSYTLTKSTVYGNQSFEVVHIQGTVYRIAMSLEFISANNTIRFYAFTGQFNDPIWIGGFQLEKGDKMTSYIPTTSSQVSRIADSATLGNLFTNNLLTATEGAVYLEIEDFNEVQDSAKYPLTIGNTNGRLFILQTSNSSSIRYQFSNASYLTYNDSSIGSKKILFNYDNSSADIWVNGSKVSTNNTIPFVLLNETLNMNVGKKTVYNSLAMYNTKLTDEECQLATTL